jgi:hypothetical protein
MNLVSKFRMVNDKVMRFILTGNRITSDSRKG